MLKIKLCIDTKSISNNVGNSLMTAKYIYLLLIGIMIMEISCKEETQEQKPHIVFVIGDEEYRSEESMPMLAKIAKRELGARISLCYSVDSAGYIDPNRSDHIAGLEALESADLMVIFTRFRALPQKEREYITNYAESGKPIVGFRTSTHAFLYPSDSTLEYMFTDWPTKVFGQQWITHHGHFDDGNSTLTSIKIKEGASHPILNGVEPFDAYSWLYHVDGGDWKLYGDCQPLLYGTALRSNHEEKGQLDKYPLTNPVAWTKTYTGEKGISARVFFTTLGHPYDFKIDSMRKLAMNGIYWALSREGDIPNDGIDVNIEGGYNPSNSGFGQNFIANQRPQVID